ncbi:ABC transporter permease subunit [Paenibacillus sp. JX-17]|uniref:ABC transporter permease subunit n=1 Tax=Paenibacillus lacisoli TaxID=3064525 RepID=A0ABT9CEV3_9BACL|nr:ABC transporter permease subunit [Paenibacillus sp. JX-17]MDO7907799.1 ABC transporter permease subunit [Paenibacillus sp. JX-17]
MTVMMYTTWKELVRKKVLVLTLLLTVLFLLAFWFIAGSIGMRHPANPEQLFEQFSRRGAVLSLGFFFGSFIVAFLSIFSSFSVISGEAEQSTLQAVLARPLLRWKWYLGRWIGYVVFIALYALLLFTAIVTITAVQAGMTRIWQDIVYSLFLFLSVVPLLVSMSMLGSSLFSGIGNGVFMTMLYGAGWLGGMIEKMRGFLDLKEPMASTLANIASLLSLIMPADGIQRRMQYILSQGQGRDIPFLSGGSVPSDSFLIYGAIYGILAIIIGLQLFRRKDM